MAKSLLVESFAQSRRLIHWAATNCMPPDAATHCLDGPAAAAGDALRNSAVAFYAKAMSIRFNKSKTSSATSTAAAPQPPVAA
jgi:hypothetical protein